MFTASDMTQCRDIMVIDPALGVEIARQSELHRLLKQHTSAMQPPDYDFRHSRRILDLACGPGDWVHDVAFADAELDVFGIDASPAVIQHARNMARTQGLENTCFQVMDLLAPLDFGDQDFDFINGRFLNACLPPEAWPSLLAECWRILKPGGCIRLIDCCCGISSSRACERLSQGYGSALWLRGLRCTPVASEIYLSAAPLTDVLLTQAGYEAIVLQRQTFDFSANRLAHWPMLEQMRAFFPLVKPFVLSMSGIDEALYERLYQQALAEWYAPDFYGVWIMGTTWGRKPRK